MAKINPRLAKGAEILNLNVVDVHGWREDKAVFRRIKLSFSAL
jgi:hypothetical protein